jgi:hypothetical protein
VAAKLAELSVHLGGVWERKVGRLVAEQVQSVDLLGEDGSHFVVEGVEVLKDGFASTRFSVVHGMESGHRSNPGQ